MTKGQLYLHTTLIATALGLMLLSRLIQKHASHLVEIYYSKGIYPVITRLLSIVSDLFPFSLSEIALLLLAGAGGILLLQKFLHLLLGKETPKEAIKKITLTLLSSLSLLYILFQLIWGLNYLRNRLEYKLDLNLQNISQKDIFHEAQKTAHRLNQLYPYLEVIDIKEVNRQLEQSLEIVLQHIEGIHIPSAKRVKKFQLNFLLDKLGIDGVTFPYFSEAHINTNQLPLEIPFTIAHEKAHLKGYAAEDEASFIGYLACIYAKSNFIRYSGEISLLDAMMSFLNQKQYKKILQTLSPPVRLDYHYIATSNPTPPTPLSSTLDHLQSSLEDKFLKLEGVPHGMNSYEYVVYLVVAYKKKWLPPNSSPQLAP